MQGAFRTQVVAVAERSLAYIGDDFHVTVAMQGKAGTWCDLIVIPDDQRSQRQMALRRIGAHLEVVAGTQPGQIGFVQCVPRSVRNHDVFLRDKSLRWSTS